MRTRHLHGRIEILRRHRSQTIDELIPDPDCTSEDDICDQAPRGTSSELSPSRAATVSVMAFDRVVSATVSGANVELGPSLDRLRFLKVPDLSPTTATTTLLLLI